MIFSVPSLYILVYEACKKCRFSQTSGENIKPTLLSIPSIDDSGTEMDQESSEEQSGAAAERTKSVQPLQKEIQQGNSSDSAFYHEEAGIQFSTPVYIQRYCAVVEALQDTRWKGKMKTVVDMGCSELGFFQHLKNTEGLTKIIAVDVDLFILESFSWKVAPLCADFLRTRDEELSVIVMKGSVSQYDSCLEGCDALVCIELIEHLFPEELDALPYVILGQVQPQIAVFTTPNDEFNVLFNNPTKRFRHPDHKFEWTREQFEDWAKNLTERYPFYKVEFVGIGTGPEGTEETNGCCSQMALFYREDLISGGPSKIIPPSKESNYKLVKEVVYPKNKESPLDVAHKAKCKAEYHIHALGGDSSFDEPNGDTLIPLTIILQFVGEYFQNTVSLRECLESHNWKVQLNSCGQQCIKYENVCSDNSEFSDEADVDSVHFEPCHYTSRGAEFGLEQAAPRPWQSEPHLQAAFPFAQQYEAPAAESLMFRSVNERQIFGYKSSMSDPIRVDDSGYPNSASVQDMDVTLGSSDDLSASNDEDDEAEEDDENQAPRVAGPPPPFVPPAAIPANNHDAVNNNRDDEGNDLGLEMIPLEQPPVAVPRPPEFPRWLLLVLADERDEGFADESSSSEDD
ncbi:small RNA 2'-O-methyltransferase [Neocloeon triangulifer]|uniref:small RNA 2'-O-methyltransferase n=1 Tax=Neocloeon triangulifer TaxID=2078957 RepID=UPI00286F1ACB|nr:small RNA 2'-O-methyltransferase [Neocloeon triangulifer]